MTEEVKAEFPIGKTQWAKWGSEARKAYNHCIRVGYEFATAVAEGNAVQAKVRAGALQELADLGQEQDPEENVPQVETSAPAPKKPRATRKKKAE